MEQLDLLNLYREEAIACLQSLPLEEINTLTKLIINCWKRDHSVFLMGNGGNAAFCANWATDLNLHPFVSEDKDKPLQITKRLRVFNLSNDATTITGIVNDLGGDNIFVEQLKYLAKPGDLVIGLSGSGNSENIKRAFSYALDNKMLTVLITRNKEGKIHSASDLIISLDCTSNFPGQTGKNNGNFHFEDITSKISHMTTGLLKKVVYESL